MPRYSTSLKKSDLQEGKPVKVDVDDKAIVVASISGMVFARCNELHANAEGKTESQARSNIKEAIALMVEDLGKEKGYSLKFVRKY